jgi:universal stress protein E
VRHIDRILVAVKDPYAGRLPGVAKAAQLARALHAELTLFRAVPAPHSGSEPNVQLDALEVIARRLRRRAIRVSVSVQAHQPADEAILREAARIQADLIVAEAHPRGHHGAALLHLTDWELLRRSPVPVLLVKRPDPYRHPNVLVALDPDHTFDKPVRLDAEILAVGSTITNALQGTLHAVHAYAPVPPSVISHGTTSAAALMEVQRLAAATATDKLAGAVRTADIPAARRHVIGRHVPDAIEEVAVQCRSAMVVMGAVARSGLKRLLIGNTVERVLDQLSCDILVVKTAQPAQRVPSDTPVVLRNISHPVVAAG